MLREGDIYTPLNDFGPREKNPSEGTTQGAGPMPGPLSPQPTSRKPEEDKNHPGPAETTKQLQLQKRHQALNETHRLPTPPGPSATTTLDDPNDMEPAPATPAPIWPRTLLGIYDTLEPSNGNNVTPSVLHTGPAGTTRSPSDMDLQEEPNANDAGPCRTLAKRSTSHPNPQNQEQQKETGASKHRSL